MPSQRQSTPFSDRTRAQVVPPEITFAGATGHNHATNNGQRKTQDSSRQEISEPGIIAMEFGLPSQQPDIDGVRFRPSSPKKEPNTSQRPGSSSVKNFVGRMVPIGLGRMIGLLQYEQEKSWQHQYQEQIANIKKQHLKETTDLKEQHRKQTANARRETTELRKQLDRSGDAAVSWKKQFESLKAKSNREYNALRESYQREQRERERLSAENSRQVVELQEYVKRLDRLAVVVENKKLYVGPQESDQKLSNDFEEIFRLVKRFSLAFLTEHQVSKKELENPNFRELLNSIMTGSESDYIQLLVIKKTRRLLVQGIIAYMLAHYVFRRLTNDPGAAPAALDYWSKSNAVAIDGIERTLWEGQPEITARELNDWRAFTISLLSRAENSMSDTTTAGQTPGSKIGAAIINHVMEWIAEWAKALEVYEELEDQLRYILQAAFDLSLQLRKQRAWWFVKLPPVTDGVIKFDPATMEDIDKKNEDDDEMQIGKTVALVFFPGLYKCGDADGDNYNSEICIVKAQVKCLERESARGPAREPAREPARGPARESAREPAKEPARESAREPAREPARGPARGPAREQASEPAKNRSSRKGKNKAVGHPPFPDV
ncbi:hypothetical protein EV426DRAFT_645740 [Tirmania nivea]|nr:hypothetical protein EV426DRAFT_645740 [Tirmania nivea]